ncbi:MAG: M3 family metallopeptidase [Crocinitomicaceae bacterium]|nr:M3 family metallopeptidase [Crocinitomicaceae bacterium]
MENILLKPFVTPYQTAPFEQINTADFLPAIEQLIAEAKEGIDAIVAQTEAPTFENTIERLEFNGMHLGQVTSIFFNLNSAETTPEMQELAQTISPMVTAFGNDVTLNKGLFERIKTVYDQKENLDLNPEQMMLLEKKYSSFTKNGALLNDEDKEKLRSIDSELSKLALTFSENVLAETQDFILHIEDEAKLAGLPDFVRDAAKEEAEQRELTGWVFTLDYPSYGPFMTYADDRELRKEMAIAFGARAFKGNDKDNTEVVQRIVGLRHQRAQLLGFDDHATFVLQNRMAQSPDAVKEFLNELLEKALPAAQREFKELTAFANNKDGIRQLEKWDGAYYSEKLKKELFELDDELLKPYFELDKVLNGSFEIVNRLFGASFVEVDDIQKYHPDVKTYKVVDDKGELISVFYADFHPRKGKRAGAWMTSFKDQYQLDGANNRPHVAIVCNFSKPTSSKPSLLSFNEVTTLFHELGHAIHGMFANTVYPSLSGTSVYWDFVELPSQLLENWCYEPEALELFAKHYETGEVIPMKYIEKIKESSNFMEGLATLRQLSFGMLDMAYHADATADLSDLKAFEKSVMSGTSLYPDVPENMMSTQFSHIFAGGYSAGYYSYKWAEVLDADAFAYFQEYGIFNEEVARKFKETVLTLGGTIHPMDLYKQFRGQEPSSEALLRRAGLIK